MKFIENYTLDLKKLPKYPKFNGIFREDLDRHLIELLMKDRAYSTDTKKLLNTQILSKLRSDDTHIHSTTYRQSYGIGRFYGNTITNFQKKIKHTLFQHLGWCDADMVKGHPTLMIQSARINNDHQHYPTINEYVNNPEAQFTAMTEHYGEDLLEHQKKWLFNSMIYGGGHQGWVDALTDPPDKDLQRGYTATPLKNRHPRPFEVQFKLECDRFKETIYTKNPALAELLKTEDKNKKHFKDRDIEIDEPYDQPEPPPEPEGGEVIPLYKLKNKVVSYYLQILENECLYHMYEYLVKESILLPKYCSLEKDGICFKPNKEIDIDTAEKINDYTFKKTDFRIKWKFKPYEDENVDTHLIGIRETYCPEKTENTSLAFNDEDEKYEAMKREFEATHFKVKDNDCYFITKNKGREVDNVKERVLVAGNRHLCYGYNTKNTDVGKVLDKSSPLSFIERWIRDENILVYDGVGYYPPPTPLPENHFNLWTPFPYQDLEDIVYEKNQEGLETILGFIKTLCKEEEAVFQYFLKWLGQMLQFPAQKTGQFPIFISDEGGGKGTLIEIIKRLVGEEKFFETTNPEDTVWGHFNPMMMNAYFVYINEFGKKNQEDADGRIKGLLTDSAITINGKGKDPFKMKSYHRFLGSTNNEDPVNVKKGNRRKWVIRCSDQLKGNKEYFTEMYKLIGDPIVMRTLFDYLMDIDCEGMVGEDPPKPQYQEELEASNEHMIQQFLKWGAGDFDYYKQRDFETHTEGEVIEYKANDLYDKFKRFKTYKHYHLYETSSPALIKKILLYNATLPDDIIVKKRDGNNNKTLINWRRVKEHFNLVDEEANDDENDSDDDGYAEEK
jgi:hypothetical protein